MVYVIVLSRLTLIVWWYSTVWRNGGNGYANRYMEERDPNYYVFNLGTGRGASVLDMVRAMEKVSEVEGVKWIEK